MCRPITRHFKCSTCKSYFSKTTGDCIGSMALISRCPYCHGTNIESVEENAFREKLDFLKSKIKKVIK